MTFFLKQIQLVQKDGVCMDKKTHASLSAFNNNGFHYLGSTLVKLSSTTKLNNTDASGLLSFLCKEDEV